jgi:AraC-like DNA-binding protein
MRGPARLYEGAISEDKADTLLHAGSKASFWAGSANYLDRHQGSVPVFLAGLYGKFRLRLEGQRWMSCRAAVIPPGVWHELDFGGTPFAALYAEPNHGGFSALAPLLRSASSETGALTGDSDVLSLLLSFYEDRLSAPDLEQGLGELLGFARWVAPEDVIDPRLAQVIVRLTSGLGEHQTTSELAQLVGLSSSRFQHLFTRQTGIPFRRYRAWSRLRQAWLQIAKGASITEAAHGSGFFDSAHLAHEYRRTFGAVPSNGLRRKFRVIGPNDHDAR